MSEVRTIYSIIDSNRSYSYQKTEIPYGEGAVKNVYLTTDDDKVVAFYNWKNLSEEQKAENNDKKKTHLQGVVGRFREHLAKEDWNYWSNRICLPEDIVQDEDMLGFIMPKIPDYYWFKAGEPGIIGEEKQITHFTDCVGLSNGAIAADERGDLPGLLKSCACICETLSKLHSIGLAHSDISEKNVLIDPARGEAIIIDTDGIVTGDTDPDVIGTPEYQAPELITESAPKHDNIKDLVGAYTDRYSLAVLIHRLFLKRYPLLEGTAEYDEDNDERNDKLKLQFGPFNEHPNDKTNVFLSGKSGNTPGNPAFPWRSIEAYPYTSLGPYLAPLILQTFTDGLKNRTKRPRTGAWKDALEKTQDIIIASENPDVKHQFYIWQDFESIPYNPFTQKNFSGVLFKLEFYSYYGSIKPNPEDHFLTVYVHNTQHEQFIENRHVYQYPENDSKNKSRAKIRFHSKRGCVIVQNIDLSELTYGINESGNEHAVEGGKAFELVDGLNIVLSKDKKKGGRMLKVKRLEF